MESIGFIEKTAYAKINLYLHVVGKRPDGYHLLDSLFCFTEYGDIIKVFPSNDLSLTINGRFADSLDVSDNNLVLKSAKKLQNFFGINLGAKIILTKNLPISSGIGGGSADAAVTLKALLELWQKDIDEKDLDEIALSLGADVPACLRSCPILVSGIGEVISKAPKLPDLWVVLVNPLRSVSTPEVFRTREGVFSEQMPMYSGFYSSKDFINEISLRKNDLEKPAMILEPSIKEVLSAINCTKDCLLARMSGSGATCFGLYENKLFADNAVAKILSLNSRWWAVSSNLICE